MKKTEDSGFRRIILLRILICEIILVAGVGGMFYLSKLKKPPPKTPVREKAISVKVMEVVPQNKTIVIKGYGEAKPLKVVTIAAEVSGKIIDIYDGLNPGALVRKNDLLFKIDPNDYQARYEENRSMVRQLTHAIQLLEKQFANDKEQSKTFSQNKKLAKAEFDRIRKLFKQGVSTRAALDTAERTYNTISDQADQLIRSLKLYPIRIKETKSRLEGAKAILKGSLTRLERCEITAPFNGRIKEIFIEKNQFIPAGSSALVFADDSMIEIRISLDSRETRKWLMFDESSFLEPTAWFPPLTPVTCRIRWTESPENYFWEGKLHRVVRFDKTTRTIEVAVRVPAKNATSPDNISFPLVEGMFCLVEIPGKTIKNVILLPRWAMSKKETVYIVKNNRLKTVRVNIERISDGIAFISGGLDKGDLVIVTRLIAPLENSLIHISKQINTF